MIAQEDKKLFELNLVWQAGFFSGITGEESVYKYRFRRITQAQFIDQFENGYQSGNRFNNLTGPN